MKMMVFLAIVATANLVWAITGNPVRPPIAAFAGFICGAVWALLWAMWNK